MLGNDYRSIIQPGAPSTYKKDPGKYNPYGRDTEQPFLISEKMELLTLTSFDLDNSSSSEKRLFWSENYNNSINTNNAQTNAEGTTAKAYFSDHSIWNGSSFSGFDRSGAFAGTGGWDSKYNLSFARAVAWDPTGSGRKDHAAFCGVYYDSSTKTSYLRVWDMDTVTGAKTEILDLGKLDWLYYNALRGYEGNNYFSITAGDFNGDEKDGLVVYFPGSRDNYGLYYLSYVQSTASSAGNSLRVDSAMEKTLLHDVYPLRDMKNSSDGRDRLCCALDSGDVNGDDIDDLVVLSYIQYPSSSSYLYYEVNFYRPYLSVALGSSSMGNNGADIVKTKTNGIGVIDGGTLSDRRTKYTSMVSPGLSLGDIDNSRRKSIVVAGLQNIILSNKDDPSSTYNSFYDLGNSLKNLQIGAFTVSSTGTVTRSYFGSTAANEWTKGGTYKSDYVWAQTAVKCTRINGANSADFTFINGTLYEVRTNSIRKLFEPEYFQTGDAGAGGSVLSNVYISSVDSAVFDGNQEGREQVVFTMGLKTKGGHNYHFRYGIMGGCQFDQSFDSTDEDVKAGVSDEISTNARAYYSSNIDYKEGYVIDGRGDYLYQNMNCLVLGVDRNYDGTYARLSKDGAGYLYSNPVVEAILQAAPYFAELGQTAGGTTYTMTTTFGSSHSTEKSHSFGGGFADDFKSTAVTVNVKTGGGGGFSSGYTDSFTKKYSQSFKAASQDTVVITRTPVLTYSYDVLCSDQEKSEKHLSEDLYTEAKDVNGNHIGWWRIKALTVTVPQEPAAVQMTIDEYNAFVDAYNKTVDDVDAKAAQTGKHTEITIPKLTKLDPNVINMAGLTGNEGNPWEYNPPWSTAEVGPDLLINKASSLGYSGGASSAGYSYDESTAARASRSGSYHFDIAIKGGFDLFVVGNYTGGYFSYDYKYTSSWTTTRGSGTSIGGTVNDLSIKDMVPSKARSVDVLYQYGFTWYFGQYGLRKKDGSGIALDGNKTRKKMPKLNDRTDPQTGTDVKVVEYDEQDVENQTLVLAYAIDRGTLTAPLAPPTDLRVSETPASGGTTKVLKWEGSVQSSSRGGGKDAAKYNVYAVQSDGGDTLVGTVNASSGSTGYEYNLEEYLKDKSGQIITFAVTALTDEGKESVYSNKITLNTGGSGKDGKSAYELAVEMGYEGSLEEWLKSLIGSDGQSAYKLAVEKGFIGTETEWLESLVGAQGASGASAYQVAVQHGYSGTEEQWLNNLNGSDGRSAYELYVENVMSTGTGSEKRSEWDTGLRQKISELSASEDADLYYNSFYQLYVSFAEAAEKKYYTQAEWMKKLMNEAGYNVYRKSVRSFEKGLAEWTEGLSKIADPDMSAYYEYYKNCVLNSVATPTELNLLKKHNWLTELMKDSGFRVYYETVSGNVLTEEEWLNSLSALSISKITKTVSEDGRTWYYTIHYNKADKEPYVMEISVPENGKSAYQIAVEHGFSGTEEEWLAALKGETGASAYSSYVNTSKVSRSVWDSSVERAFDEIGSEADLYAVQQASYTVFEKAMEKVDPAVLNTPGFEEWTEAVINAGNTGTLTSMEDDDITPDRFKDLTVRYGYTLYLSFYGPALMSEETWAENLRGNGVSSVVSTKSGNVTTYTMFMT
ncbi:MAG: hypothetical protein Q4D40_07260, partial [Eubacteriales bacterium]|nr:hypothetical protein [Eubacteriales bacterium]